MNFNRLLILTFVILLVIIGIEGFFLVNTNQTKVVTLPSITPSSNLKILYQAPGDKEGRTIIYETSNPSFHYSGIGEIIDKNRSIPLFLYAIGSFDRWEKIPGTADRYLILKNILNNKFLSKIRVTFEPSKLSDNQGNLTSLFVENLESGQLEYLEKKVYQFPSKALDLLIKKNDVLIATILPVLPIKGEIIHRTDSQGFAVVSEIYIRRNQGKKTINTENKL